MMELTLYNQHQHDQLTVAEGPLLLSWTPRGWQSVATCGLTDDAPLLQITPTDGAAIVTAAGCGQAAFVDGTSLDLSSAVELPLPSQLIIDGTHLAVASPHNAHQSARLEPLDADSFNSRRGKQQTGLSPATVSSWLESLATLHQWPAGQSEFFAAAARFVVDPVGLDGAMVLRTRSDGNWEIVASHLPHPELGVRFEPALVERTIEMRMTLFHPSCMESQAMVVTPLYDADGNSWGAIYGFRDEHAGNGRRGVRYLEAHLVELLAHSVQAGLSRIETEAASVRQRVVYEQAFAPAIATQMQLRDTPLTGSQRDVTVLFADLRGFTELCEKLQTADAYLLLNDVMDALTAALMQYEGTLIDYYGDGLAAMWNAPLDQTNHTELACKAGMAMLEALPAISTKWQHALAEPLRLGVGIHTGPAQVGNIGSTQRMKYGPRGSTVNLASRIEAATKLIGTPLLLSQSVATKVATRLPTYRVCQANLPGASEPMELYSLRPQTDDPSASSAVDRYEQALAHYESGDLANACALLQGDRKRDDLPAEFLAHQIQLDCSRKLGRRANDTYPQAPTAVIELPIK